MKLNLLILFLVGVSASASGIRGFTPIKGDERRLSKTSSSSGNSKSKSADITVFLTGDDKVVDCSGARSSCRRFFDECTILKSSEFDATSKKSSSSSSKSKRVRRLKTTSTTSKTKSSEDDYELYTITMTLKDLENGCDSALLKTLNLGDNNSSSSSKSKTTSKKGRRLSKGSSSSSTDNSKSSRKARLRLVADGGEIECLGDIDDDECDEFISKCVRVVGSSSKKSSSSKSKGDRRLKTSPTTSKTKSSEDDDGPETFRLVRNNFCNNFRATINDIGGSSSSSKSKTTSKKGRRLAKSSSSSSSSKSRSGGSKKEISVVVTKNYVECYGKDKDCNQFLDNCTEGSKKRSFRLKNRSSDFCRKFDATIDIGESSSSSSTSTTKKSQKN